MQHEHLQKCTAMSNSSAKKTQWQALVLQSPTCSHAAFSHIWNSFPKIHAAIHNRQGLLQDQGTALLVLLVEN